MVACVVLCLSLAFLSPAFLSQRQKDGARQAAFDACKSAKIGRVGWLLAWCFACPRPKPSPPETQPETQLETPRPKPPARNPLPVPGTWKGPGKLFLMHVSMRRISGLGAFSRGSLPVPAVACPRRRLSPRRRSRRRSRDPVLCLSPPSFAPPPSCPLCLSPPSAPPFACPPVGDPPVGDPISVLVFRPVN